MIVLEDALNNMKAIKQWFNLIVNFLIFDFFFFFYKVMINNKQSVINKNKNKNKYFRMIH